MSNVQENIKKIKDLEQEAYDTGIALYITYRDSHVIIQFAYAMYNGIEGVRASIANGKYKGLKQAFDEMIDLDREWNAY